MVSANKARSFGAILGKIITPVCRKNGLMTADLILDWGKIVGPHLASVCKVIKITFTYAAEASSQKQGCLHLKVNSAMAATLPYNQSIILERINQYYGYQAVHRLRIFHQNEFVKKTPISSPFCPSVKTVLSPDWHNLLQKVPDNSLRKALENLGQDLQQGGQR